MAYTRINFRTGISIRKQFAERVRLGHPGIEVYQPGPFGPNVPDGPAVIEGPHYPEAHRFYVSVIVKGGVIVKVNK